MTTCEYVEVDEQCDYPAEYRCTPWTTDGDYLETSGRLVCGDSEHLFQTVAGFLSHGAASVDVTAWLA